MDDLDRRLIRLVQSDCSLGAALIAEQCGTTESTVRRRLKRLVADGTLSSPRMQASAEKVGQSLKVILSFQLRGESNAEIESLRKRLIAHPNVIDLYFVTGDWDYILILSLASMEDYERFLREMVLGEPSLSASQTHVVINSMKVAAPIPVAT